MSTTDTPEAQPPTWDDALAHAEVLREQGVDVRIDERYRVIEIRGDNGKRHDPADGTPAWQGFYPSGTTEWISHWTNGRLHDPDGIPARQAFYPDGTPKVVEHWTNGKLVSEERFPPPIGEA